jgi:hypothetical protein
VRQWLNRASQDGLQSTISMTDGLDVLGWQTDHRSEERKKKEE